MTETTTYRQASINFLFPDNPDFEYSDLQIHEAFRAWNYSIYQQTPKGWTGTWEEFCDTIAEPGTMDNTYNYAGLCNEEDTQLWTMFWEGLDHGRIMSSMVTQHLFLLHDEWVSPNPYPGTPY